MFFIAFTIMTTISLLFSILFLIVSEVNRNDFSFILKNIGYMTTLFSFFQCFLLMLYNYQIHYALLMSIIAAMIGTIRTYRQNTKRYFKQNKQYTKTLILILLLMLWIGNLIAPQFKRQVHIAIYTLSLFFMILSFTLS